MTIVDEAPGVLLVNRNPLSGGGGANYGFVLRMAFAQAGTGTTVVCDCRRKVPYVPGNGNGGFRDAEGAVRMRAKAAGLHELMSGLDDIAPAVATASVYATSLAPAPRPVPVPAAAPVAGAPAPGWYPDPTGDRALRYWDGLAWTAHVQPRPAS